MDIDMLCFVIDMDFDMIRYVEIKDLKPIFARKENHCWKVGKCIMS